MSGCASNVRFEARRLIFREGTPADTFYLIREGKVAVEILCRIASPSSSRRLAKAKSSAGRGCCRPIVWKFNGHAVQQVRAIALDGKCLRTKCEENHDLGYEILKRLVQIMEHRLDAARFQQMDVYAVHR